MSGPSQEIIRLDKDLAPYTAHLNYRWQAYLDMKSRIEKAEGSLEKFSRVGHLAVTCPITLHASIVIHRQPAPFTDNPRASLVENG